MSRIELGREQISCSCKQCVDQCRYIPGYLIPSDLARLVPTIGNDVPDWTWADAHLMASPGAVIMDRRTAATMRVRTIVPATAGHGSHACVFLKDDRCSIHDRSPFGCACFRACTPLHDDEALSIAGLLAICRDWDTHGAIYKRAWNHLYDAGRIAEAPAIKRQRMARELGTT
jgi:hypothetical protein